MTRFLLSFLFFSFPFLSKHLAFRQSPTGMSDINLENLWIDFVMSPLDSIGILHNRGYRAIFFGTLATLAVWTFKPSLMFDKDTGRARPWIFFSNSANATPFTWETFVIMITTMSILFV